MAQAKKFSIDGYEFSSTSNYEELEQKPSIEGVLLEGNKTLEDLNFERITNTEIEEMLT